MRARGASELRKLSPFHTLKLLFLSICCWYFMILCPYYDKLVSLHIPTNFEMYRQNLKSMRERAAIAPAPPPPLATLVAGIFHIHWHSKISCYLNIDSINMIITFLMRCGAISRNLKKSFKVSCLISVNLYLHEFCANMIIFWYGLIKTTLKTSKFLKLS